MDIITLYSAYFPTLPTEFQYILYITSSVGFLMLLRFMLNIMTILIKKVARV